MSENIEFPTAPSDITLEYQTMDNNVNVKQADVILLAYPLDYDQNNYTEADKLLDLDYVSPQYPTPYSSLIFHSIPTDSLQMGRL
jgi:trehalose/maltose hydrolase-like predicted phosphorylase